SKSVKHLGGAPSTPYFNPAELQFAIQLVGMSQERARTRTETETASNTEEKAKTRTETVRSFSK
ncbi:MAG: hypothetical protein KDA77_22035, partial [Planctomycetaceae bacterium]|nr:hypothetical protein [Planctomycetaceae bacterium]